MEIKLSYEQERELLLNQLRQQSIDRLVKHYEELLKEIEEEENYKKELSKRVENIDNSKSLSLDELYKIMFGDDKDDER